MIMPKATFLLSLCLSMAVAGGVLAQDAPKPAPKPESPAKPEPKKDEKKAEEKKDEAPQSTIDLLKRIRTVLEHYWNANYEATVAKQDFKSAEAWEKAAKAGDFKDYKSYGEAVAAQKKTDPVHFAKRHEELRKEVEAAHRKKLADLQKGQ